MWPDVPPQAWLVAGGYVLIIGVPFTLSWWLQRKQRLDARVRAVKDRLTPKPALEHRVTVQANDGTQFAFSTSMQLAVGDFVEAQADGTLHVAANLLPSNRIVGVVVRVETKARLL